ncbi:MAG: hypothetical protein KDA27_28225, partial [Candidatus Eisenbacteria bacterium]|nr:hypothetical protein [Candidatus Eisenbacteria bacterium]
MTASAWWRGAQGPAVGSETETALRQAGTPRTASRGLVTAFAAASLIALAAPVPALANWTCDDPLT